ncbi:MAG TPA: APC family permease [Candidatus Acidoferrales bacterium]|nr:APC family permease [Candidatus Acidoferrales bacterium]
MARDDEPSELVRGLGLWASIAVIVGAMVGQAIFLVPSEVARDVGSAVRVLAAWLIGGAIVLLTTFCFAELGAALPRAGGEYVYLGRGLGPKWGFLFGWTGALLVGPATSATIAAGLLRLTSFLLPSVRAPIFALNIPDPFRGEPYHFVFTAARGWAAAAIAAVTVINYLGVRTAGRVQILITGLKVAGIVLIVALGLTLRNFGGAESSASSAALAYGGAGTFVAALVPIMLAYDGFQALGQVGGEISDPRRTLPRAAIFGVLAVVVMYFLINLVYVRVLGVFAVASSQHVGPDAAARLAGPDGARWLTMLMILSALGSLHVIFLVRPRVLYAMARDGRFFSFVGRVQPTFRTPSGALLLQGGLAVVLVLTGTFEEIFSLVIFAVWIFVALTAVALIGLRKKEPALSRPYRAWGYPWTPLIVVAAGVAMSVNQWLARPVRSSIGLALILLGIPIFHHWRKRAVDRPPTETGPSGGV